jgi:hypothetical protein
MTKVWYKSYPEKIPFNLDYEEISLFDMLKKTAQNYPNNIAIILDYDNFCQIVKKNYLIIKYLKKLNLLMNYLRIKQEKF